MLIFLPPILLIVTALVLILIRKFRPGARFAWGIALGGAVLSLVLVFFWHVDLPRTILFFRWQPATIFSLTPTLLVDGISWPMALSISALCVVVIVTSIAYKDRSSISWTGTLVLSAIGLASVTAANPLTLAITWAVLDLTELAVMLATTRNERDTRRVVIAFAVHMLGIGLLVWASSMSGGWTDFRNTPSGAGLVLLLASGTRLGIIPLRLPYQHENTLLRGFGTALRLISASASMALVARLPESAIPDPWNLAVFISLAFIALYAGWKWLHASEELTGRPFWVIGIAAMAVGTSLRFDPVAAAAWGSAMLLGGSLLFLYSVRQRKVIWIPLLGLWSLSTLPYSLTAASWGSTTSGAAMLWLCMVPGQALFIAGFIRHALHPGDSSLESQPDWVKGTYLSGLLILLAFSILLGVWGWDGSGMVGIWWLSPITSLLIPGAVLTFYFLPRLNRKPVSLQPRRLSLNTEHLQRAAARVYTTLDRGVFLITSTLEGESGMLWSFLLLILLISLYSSLY